MATTCPKDGGPAYRVYSQVFSPDTRRSTSVALPVVFCGELGDRDGLGCVLSTKHGLVELTPAQFNALRRKTPHRNLARTNPAKARKNRSAAKTPKAPRARGKAPPKPRKGSGRSNTKAARAEPPAASGGASGVEA